jgi:long-chain acyl-CoA synthetase
MDVARKLVLPGSPFELTDASVNGRPCRVFRRAPDSLADIYRKARHAAEQPFLHVDGCDITYGELLEGAANLAGYLIDSCAAGVGTRIGLVLPANAAWWSAFVAVTSVGASAVLIDASIDIEAMVSAIETTQLRILIADERVAQALREAGFRGRIVVDVPEAPGVFRSDSITIPPDAEALVAFTSGSTGRPKGVACSHRAIITGLMGMSLGSALAAARAGPRRRPFEAGRRPVSLLLSPFTHVGGYLHVLMMMQVAGKVIPSDGAPASRLIDLIQHQSVTTLSGVGAQVFSELLREPPPRDSVSSLARIGVHGVALRAELINDLHARFPEVEVGTGYGLTETSGSVSVATSVDFEQHPGTCGSVVPSAEIRIIDEDGHEVTNGTQGSIEVRGAMLASGYCHSTEANTRAFRDGWFRTDDLGSLDSNGFLTVSDRRGHLIRLDGKTFSGSDIEQAAIGTGLVADAAALQISNAAGAEHLLLAVVVAPGSGDAQASLGRALHDSFGVAPGLVTVLPMPQLPRTRSGKLDRQALQARGTGY